MQPDMSLPAGGVVPVFARSFGSWHLSLGRRPYGPRELASHYDAASGGWTTTLDRLGFGAAYGHLIGRALGQCRYGQTARDLTVLDAGIGTGAMSAALRDHIGRRFQLDGIDVSAAMLHQAASHLSGLDVDIALRQADLTKLPTPDKKYDIVLVAHVLEHLANPEAALSELYRVLKPGGTLLCCITRRSALGAYIQLAWRTHRVDPPVAMGWLRRSGLRSVRTIPLPKGSAARRLSLGYVGRKPLGAQDPLIS